MFLSVKFFYLLSSVGKYNFVSYEQAQSEAALYSLPGRLLPPHLWRKPLLVSCKSCPGFFMHINKNMNVYSHPLSFYKCYHIYNVLCFAFLNLIFWRCFLNTSISSMSVCFLIEHVIKLSDSVILSDYAWQYVAFVCVSQYSFHFAFPFL